MFGDDVLGSLITEETSLIRDTFEEYCRKKIEPVLPAWKEKRAFPAFVMKDVFEILGSGMLPDGESNRIDEIALGTLSEVMGRYAYPIPAFLTIHFSKLLQYMEKDAREKYYRKLLQGESVICGAFSEPGCGSDSAAIKTEASHGGSHFTINGEKAFVSSPGIADLFIISARTASIQKDKPGKGISLLAVEADSENVEPYSMENMASEYDGDFGGVYFRDVEIDENMIIGPLDGGFKLLMNVFNVQRVHVALYALGLAEKSLEEAIEYAKMRKTFGRSISRNQAVSFRLAEDWTAIEASRLLAYNALRMSETGSDASAYCAAVKYYACENAFKAVSDSLQTLGASGYVKSSEMEFRFRAARGFLIGDGTPDIQKMIISRHLFGKDNI